MGRVEVDGPKPKKWKVENDIKLTLYESGRSTENETGRSFNVRRWSKGMTGDVPRMRG